MTENIEHIKMPTEDRQIVYSKDGKASIELKDGTYTIFSGEGRTFFASEKNEASLSVLTYEGPDEIKITVSGEIDASQTDYVYNPKENQ